MTKIEHYLISLPVIGPNYLHCYLMTDDRRALLDATEKVLQLAEKAIGGNLPLPIILSTMLGDSAEAVALVHDCLRAIGGPEWEKKHKRAKRYHFSVFATNEDSPWHHKLMELH